MLTRTERIRHKKPGFLSLWPSNGSFAKTTRLGLYGIEPCAPVFLPSRLTPVPSRHSYFGYDQNGFEGFPETRHHSDLVADFLGSSTEGLKLVILKQADFKEAENLVFL